MFTLFCTPLEVLTKFAFFEKNNLLDNIIITEESFDTTVKSINELSLGTDITETDNVTYQILAWDSLNGLVPLTSAITLEPGV